MCLDSPKIIENEVHSFLDIDHNIDVTNVARFIIQNIDYSLKARCWRTIDKLCTGCDFQPGISEVRNALETVLFAQNALYVEIQRITTRTFQFQIRQVASRVRHHDLNTIENFVKYNKGAKQFRRISYKSPIFNNEFTVRFYMDINIIPAYFGEFNRCFPVDSRIEFGSLSTILSSQLS